MSTTSELKPCLCGCGLLTRRRFAQGHDMRYLGQCLDRISKGQSTGVNDMVLFIPGHAERYDMDCLRANLRQSRKVLQGCFRG